MPGDTPMRENKFSPFTTRPLSLEEPNVTDQAVERLNAAARWIEEEEEVGARRLRRSARLAPLRDISSEIHRASTPHPRITQGGDFSTRPEVVTERPAPQSLNEPLANRTWSWSKLDEEEEKEKDLWANASDPLLARSRPRLADAAQIEADDIERARLENHITLPYPSIHKRQPMQRFLRWQAVFATMVILALLALGIDGFLLNFAFHHSKHPIAADLGPPSLTLSNTVANIGDTMTIHLAHFIPGTSIVLTHDIQEALVTTGNSSTVAVTASGEASAAFVITNAWKPGSHLIEAENVTTRDTASALLQIAGSGPSRPPHLLLASSTLDLGDAVQGAGTIQPLTLQNSGSGAISWSVSSSQPWLLVAPQQGLFGTGQTISVAAQRSNLQPGDYSGTLKIFSNVGGPEELQVSMKVSALPPNAGPVISLVPPLLSFATSDGISTPQSQIVTLTNPGQQALNWSLGIGDTVTTIQSAYWPSTSAGGGQRMGSHYRATSVAASWISAFPSTGVLSSGDSVQIQITAQGEDLLPGSYMSMLTFSSSGSNKAFDTPQQVGVSLTVQPRCGLVLGAGGLAFTAVAGQSNPSAHVLSMGVTSSCAGTPLAWRAWPSASWIAMNPSGGEIKGTGSSFTAISVKTAGLAPGYYKGLVTFQDGKDTQTVTVQLTLQPKPAPTVPIMGALPLSLNFSLIQGQANPAAQVVTITNNGGSPLRWHTNVSLLGNGWIATSPSGGTVLPGQTGQVTVKVATKGLTPGSYVGQVSLLGTNANNGATASGSPQAITVSLTVQPPCTLAQPSASSLLFNSVASGQDPSQQQVSFMVAGSCSWPLQWNTRTSTGSSWLDLSPSLGTLDANSQTASISVGVSTARLAPGTYTSQVQITAKDSTGMKVLNTPQSFTVTLTVLQPCTLQPLPTTLSFSALQGQAAANTQTLNLSESGSCQGGVSWTATGDTGSSAWLNLSTTTGIDSGSGSSIVASANTGSLLPGIYTGQITVSAINNGIVVVGSPQTIAVTFTVIGFTVSGTASACNGPSPTCTTSQPLVGATVVLSSGATTIASVTTDASGNFTFNNIPLGSYTITVNGTSGGAAYTATTPVTVNGNATGTAIQTFSS